MLNKIAKSKSIVLLVLSLIFLSLILLGGLSTFVKADCIGTTYNFICGDTINESCNFNSNISVNGSSCFDVSGNDIIINLNGYTLEGNRANLTKGFNASGNSNLTIINGKINQFYSAIYFDSVSNSNFSNLYFENNMRNAIYAQNSVSNVFENLYILNTSATCQYLGGSHCQYDQEEGESGLSICTGSGNNITNYTFYGDDLSNDSTECGTDSGLDLFAATNTELDYIYLYYSDTYGIMIQDVSPGTHINHYFAYGANSINKNMNDAIIQSDGSDGTIINNSYMEKMIEWGPFMNNAHDVIMNNLTIFDVNRIAIRMTTSSNNITIQNCNITNGAPEGAIYLPEATDIVLINNTLYNTTSISFSTGYNVYAENNVYQDSGGFQAYRGSNYTSKNELFNNSGVFNAYGVDVTILDSIFLNTSIELNAYSTTWSNVYLINSSYNVSQLISNQGTIYVGTYAKILVYNNTGDAIENANFTEHDNNSIARVSALTNSTGEISNYAYGFLIDENHSNPYYLNNYSMNVTHTSYLVSSQTVNVTESIENSPNFVNLTYNLTYDNILPQIEFITPTPDDEETLTVNYFNISIGITEENLLNSTIYLYYDNDTLLSETPGNIGVYNLHNGLYHYNATAYDYNENYNYTETRNITISSPVCQGDTTAFICGETVTESCNLTGDIAGIGGITCLTFGADAIIIDGFGYSIIGDGTTIGLSLGGNYGTVQNITLNNHSIGLSALSLNNVLNNIIVNNSQNRGIQLEYGDTNLINNSWIDNSLNTGIYINAQSSSGGTIVQNSNITNNGLNVTDLDKYGIYSTGHSNLNITNNIFIGNYIGYFSTNDNTVELSGNSITSSVDANVWIESSTAISLLNNNISDGPYGVNSYCQSCVFTGNNISNNNYNLFVRTGGDSSWLLYTIDDTNSFDGKLVRVYTSQTDLEANITNTAMIISSYCTNFNITNANFNGKNSHAVIIGDGTNILIENNTMTNSYYGVETIGPHIDFVVDNNTFIGTETGIYYTSNINITNNNLSQNDYGIYSTSDGGIVLNNSFDSNNNSIYFDGGDNQIVTNNGFTNNNISIFLINSADTSTFTNSLMNNNLIDLKFEGYTEITGGGGGASPPRVGGGKPPVTPNALNYYYPSDNNFVNTSFTGNLTINSWTKTNNLINSTFDPTLYSTTNDGILYIKWYLDVYVNNSDGTPADNAEVLAYDNVGTPLFDLMTNASGFIDRQTVTEYVYNSTGTTFYTNLTINATNTTMYKEKQLNLTTNYINGAFFITLTDTPTPPSNHDGHGGDEATENQTSNQTTTPSIILTKPTGNTDFDLGILTGNKQGGKITIKFNETFRFVLGNVTHVGRIVDITGNRITLFIWSDPTQVIMTVGDSKQVDLDKDGKTDIVLTFNSLKDGEADITFKEVPLAQQTTQANQTTTQQTGKTGNKLFGLRPHALLGILALLLILAIIFSMRKRKRRYY